MAADNVELVCQVISSVLGDSCIIVDCKRAKKNQDSGKELIQAYQEHSDKFRTFADQLAKQERELFATAVGRCRIASSKRSRLWSAFHSLSTNDLPKTWKKLFEEISSTTTACDYGMVKEDRLLQQSVNQKLFEHFLQEFFTVAEPAVTSEVVLGKMS